MSPQTKKQLVASICVIQLLCNFAFTQFTPFYPVKAQEKGLTVLWVGYVMMTMAIFQIISSFLIGKLFSNFKYEKYHIIMFGLVMMITQNIMLGMLEYTDSSNKFLTISFIA